MKERLDTILQKRGLAGSQKEAQGLIGAGMVMVDGQVCDKAGSSYDSESRVDIKEKAQFVSRSGYKIKAGLENFQLDPAGFVCADIGCSTGGFTDCLLQYGANHVYCVDVGYGVLDWKIRQDDRVTVLERTNARYLSRKEIPSPIDLAVFDVSFISLRLLLAPVANLFEESVLMVVLVKPQFELPRELVGKGGIVTDQVLHGKAIELVRSYAEAISLSCKGVIPSPVKGTKGNQEFLMLLKSQE